MDEREAAVPGEYRVIDLNDPRKVFAGRALYESAYVPQKGDSSLKMPANVPLGYYFLASDFWIPEGSSKWYMDGQLVKVRMRRSGTAYFDEPIKRAFHAPGLLFWVQDEVRVGEVRTGTGVLNLALTDRCWVQNWVVPDGWDVKGVDLQGSRNTKITTLTIGRPSRWDAGYGYGLGVQKCTGVEAYGVLARGCRHAIMPACIGGCHFEEVQHFEPKADFDFGHYGVEDTVFDRIDCGDRSGALGNRWPAPSNNVVLRRIRSARDLLLYSDTWDTRIEESAFSGALRAHQNLPGIGLSAKSQWFPGGISREGLADARMVVEVG